MLIQLMTLTDKQKYCGFFLLLLYRTQRLETLRRRHQQVYTVFGIKLKEHITCLLSVQNNQVGYILRKNGIRT